MERNVYSFKVALSKGFEPRMYSYDANNVPLREFEARLDFKTWSKRILAINCYFTKIDSDERFVVTVYCHHETTSFQLQSSTVDFASCPTGETYLVHVIKSEKGKVLLVKAEPVQHVSK